MYITNRKDYRRVFKMRVDNVKVYDLEESIVASGYPMRESIWEEGEYVQQLDDLFLKIYLDDEESVENKDILNKNIRRAANLGNTGGTEGHNQYLTGIRVAFDLTFSNKAWVELERYRFVEFVSSQSTMHRISKMDIKGQVNEYVTDNTIDEVNRLKEIYLQTQDKEDYLRLLYNIPSGFELTARLTTNYRALKTVYSQRKNHRLPEWREFTKWCETLPMFKELCLRDELNNITV